MVRRLTNEQLQWHAIAQRHWCESRVDCFRIACFRCECIRELVRREDHAKAERMQQERGRAAS